MAAAHRAMVDANLAAAQDIQERTRRLLTRTAHPHFTKTPSPLGSPPAMITGDLAGAIQAEHDGDDAIVGPTAAASSRNGPYGRFLELGGEHIAHSPAGMAWFEEGTWHGAHRLTKGPRPFLKPATDDAVNSGAILQIYYEHWLIAQQAVT